MYRRKTQKIIISIMAVVLAIALVVPTVLSLFM